MFLLTVDVLLKLKLQKFSSLIVTVNHQGILNYQFLITNYCIVSQLSTTQAPSLKKPIQATQNKS